MPRGRRCKQVGTRADGANSADFYAAMPPPTPRMILMGNFRRAPRGGARLEGRLRGRQFRRRSSERILHQPAAHFLHRNDGELFRGCGQHRPRAALQLPGPLGRHDDEAVRALLLVVRNGAVGVVLRGYFRHDVDTYLNLK